VNKQTQTKIAVIKYGGLAAGGTERWIQTIAANLDPEKFHLDYYYCDATPYVGTDYRHADTDPTREQYMRSRSVNLIKVQVGAKDVTRPHHPWVDTNLWELFSEDHYDLVLAARAGHAEYPFTELKSIPIVEFVTLPNLVDHQTNVVRTVHISKFQEQTWVRAGGDPDRAIVIPLFSERLPETTHNLRGKLRYPENVVVFGFHQRVDDGIFSPIPLAAYKLIENPVTTRFLLLGGSELYAKQAADLGLSTFLQLPHAGSQEKIRAFLNTLNAYTHGRSDGETFSLAIAEALSCGLPVLSHEAPAMGHKETIGPCGVVTRADPGAYAEVLSRWIDPSVRQEFSQQSVQRFETELSLEANMRKVSTVITTVVEEEVQTRRRLQALQNLDPEDFWGVVGNE
jgi:glycosyltransferase involved in cell wall biosynthesis